MSAHKNRNLSSTKGFTLVELAIVMIIIGLLIGGILKGQELIQNAKLTRLQQTVNGYRAAVDTFRDSYGAFPGDLKNPDVKLPGCKGNAACVQTGGNQNGYIGSNAAADWSSVDQSGVTSEPTQFWLHLRLADLITGLGQSTSQTWGGAYPSSPLGGGFQVMYANESGPDNVAIGHYFLLRLFPTGGGHPGSGNFVLSGISMQRIDNKYDDGLPNRGAMVADDNYSKCWSTATREYTNSALHDCYAAFKF